MLDGQYFNLVCMQGLTFFSKQLEKHLILVKKNLNIISGIITKGMQ